MAESELLDMKELKERWYTRMELLNLEEPQTALTTASLLNN
jgi:hypothetical protein